MFDRRGFPTADILSRKLSIAPVLSEYAIGAMGSSLSLPLDWNKRARFALCLDELLDILMDRNGHNHVEGGGPVDLEKELHASSFDPWYSVRTDIRYPDRRETKIRTAEGFWAAPQTTGGEQKFCGRYGHRGVYIDGRPVVIPANITAVYTPIQYTKRLSHNKSSSGSPDFLDY
jgi:hypothetical protein